MAENVVTLWGAIGTPAAVQEPSMVSKATFDAGSPSDFYAANGDHLAQGGNKTVTTDSTDFFLNDTGAFAGLTLEGIYLYMSFGASAVGYYRILSNTDDAVRFLSTGLAGQAAVIGTTDHTYSVGGVGIIEDPDTDDFFQALLDLMGTAVTSSNNLDVLVNLSFTIDTTIDIDNISGSTTTRVRIIGTNSSFVDDGTQITIDTATASGTITTVGLIQLFTASTYIQWVNFDFDGGDGATNALHCVNNPDTETASSNHTFINCRFHGATSHGQRNRSTDYVFLNCEFDNNGGNGRLNNRGNNEKVSDCSFHDNTLNGMSTDGNAATITHNLFYDNTQSGFLALTRFDFSIMKNNISWSNTVSGYIIDDLAIAGEYFNNSAVSNGTYGWDFQGESSNLRYFAYNHAYANSTAPTTLTASDALFQVFRDGNNITTDPLFESVTPGAALFLVPTSASDLVDQGLSGRLIGPLCATAGGGGGAMPLTGLLS